MLGNSSMITCQIGFKLSVLVQSIEKLSTYISIQCGFDLLVPFQGTTPAGGFALFVFTPPAVVTAITVTLVSNTGVADVYGDADLFVGTAPFVPQYGPNCSCFASSTYTASYSAVDEVRMDNTQFTWTTAVYIAVYGYGSASVTYTLTAYSYQVHTAWQTTVSRTTVLRSV